MRRGPARVLIVAGEASGDVYGGLLMRAMAGGGAVEFSGVGGPAMREAGLRPLGDVAVMGVTGLLEVAARLPAIWSVYRAVSAAIRDPDRRPDLVLLIDYPDFNLRVARLARKAGVPVLYFVSPQVWAWRRGRMRTIAGRIDRMLVILPFEEEIYRAAGVPVTFVGHPLLDLARPARGRGATLRSLGLDPLRPTVGLLPGSRRNEIRSLLPALLGAAGVLAVEFRDLQFILPVAPTLGRAEMQRLIGEAADGGAAGPRPVLVEEDRYDAVAACDAAAVASGTATLETALLGVPMVIVYRMNPITYLLARRISEVPHIGMPNLIMGERVAPELVQGDCRPDRIAAEIRRLLTDPAAAETMRQGLAGVRRRLGEPGAIGRAARAAWGMMGAATGEPRG